MRTQSSTEVVGASRYEISPAFDPDVEKLAKIYALYWSDSEGEQDAALERAKEFCKARGWSYAEGMKKLANRHLLNGGGLFSDLEFLDEGGDAGYIIRKLRTKRLQMKGVISRYGSEEAVTQLTPEESLYEGALQEAGITHETAFVEGSSLDCSEEAIAVVLRAGPRHECLTSVFEEIEGWRNRYQDLRLFVGVDAETHSLGSSVRIAALEQLVDQIDPKTTEELRRWFQHVCDLGRPLDQQEVSEIEGKLFARLERLVGSCSGHAETETSRHWTKQDTRDRVWEMKTNPETADWSLADIARELGVSKVTVHRHVKKLEKAGRL